MMTPRYAMCSKSARRLQGDALRHSSAAADHRQDADATAENAISLTLQRVFMCPFLILRRHAEA
jgi:hypothetical protein